MQITSTLREKKNYVWIFLLPRLPLYKWYIVESGVKHHKNLSFSKILKLFDFSVFWMNIPEMCHAH
jgi:hypothetical protein